MIYIASKTRSPIGILHARHLIQQVSVKPRQGIAMMTTSTTSKVKRWQHWGRGRFTSRMARSSLSNKGKRSLINLWHSKSALSRKTSHNIEGDETYYRRPRNVISARTSGEVVGWERARRASSGNSFVYCCYHCKAWKHKRMNSIHGTSDHF